MESLKAQRKNYSNVQSDFEKAWKNADEKMTLRDLWQ
jgi:hypothetical protein